MRTRPVGLAVWLLLLIGVELAALALTARYFVTSTHGQWLDAAALAGNGIGRARIDDLVDTVLNAITVVSLAVATAVVGFIALARRRVAVGLGAVLLIVGANLTTQLLKQALARPELGVDVERAAAGNSLPSGHTTVAASVAVALMLVLPARLRGAGGLLGAAFTALTGVATLSAGWHRPSDAVAALLVVGAWATAAGLFIVAAQGRYGEDVHYGRPNRLAVVTLVLAGVALLAAAGLAAWLVGQVAPAPPEEFGRYRLLAAYGGGAVAVSGAAALVFAAVLATVHRVVPQALPPAEPASPEPVATVG
jgi:membrane-associated phospholipid phosphatase